MIEYFRGDFDAIAKEGERIFEERIRLMGLQSTRELVRKFLDYSQLRDEDELWFRIGLGLLGPEDFKAIIDEKDLSGGERRKSPKREDTTRPIQYKIAECCHPIPGDPVIGFSMNDNLVIVHKKSCPVAESLASKYGNRMVVPQWGAVQQEYPIRISLKGIDRLGLLNDISSFISRTLGINMRKLQLSTEDGLFEGFIELLVRDKKNLERMVEGLSRIDGIQDVIRTDI